MVALNHYPQAGAELETKTGTYKPSLSGWSHVTHANAAAGPPNAPMFQVAVGTFMLGALLITSVCVGYQETPAPASPPAAVAGPTPGDTFATELKEIKAQVEGLSAQLKGVQGKVDGLPAPQPVPDIKPIQAEIQGLTKSIASLIPLTDRVSKLGERFGDTEASIKAMKDDVSGLEEQVSELKAEAKKLAPASPAPTTIIDEPKPTPADSVPALADGVGLFKAGKYKEAADVFNKIAATDPKDAAVYYYAAFVNGITTNDWKGETMKIAAKGAALEKAGTAKRADVDAAFADLPASLKPWLAFFRGQSK